MSLTVKVKYRTGGSADWKTYHGVTSCFPDSGVLQITQGEIEGGVVTGIPLDLISEYTQYTEDSPPTDNRPTDIMRLARADYPAHGPLPPRYQP